MVGNGIASAIGLTTFTMSAVWNQLQCGKNKMMPLTELFMRSHVYCRILPRPFHLAQASACDELND